MVCCRACGSGCVHGVYGWAYEPDSENRGGKSANDSAFCGVHYLHGSVGGMCGAWSEKLCKGRLRSVSFQGIVHIYSVIACVMNVRMAFIILFSALGSQSGVDTLIGSQSQNEFIQSQYASWICLAIATLFSVVLGILAVVWLVKNKKN